MAEPVIRVVDPMQRRARLAGLVFGGLGVGLAARSLAVFLDGEVAIPWGGSMLLVAIAWTLGLPAALFLTWRHEVRASASAGLLEVTGVLGVQRVSPLRGAVDIAIVGGGRARGVFLELRAQKRVQLGPFASAALAEVQAARLRGVLERVPAALPDRREDDSAGSGA